MQRRLINDIKQVYEIEIRVGTVRVSDQILSGTDVVFVKD